MDKAASRIRLQLTYILPLMFSCFMFHFYVSIDWLSTHSRDETYDFNVSLLVSMFHFKKTLRERFKNTVGEIQKHWGSDETLPQCFKKWNMKLKMKHWIRMFHLLNALIINKLKHKNETWKINQRFWKCMDISEINYGLP